jgi:hypothetical protein
VGFCALSGQQGCASAREGHCTHPITPLFFSQKAPGRSGVRGLESRDAKRQGSRLKVDRSAAACAACAALRLHQTGPDVPCLLGDVYEVLARISAIAAV